MSLTQEQYDFVTSPIENSLLLAGAGSGKTKCFVSRILYLTLNNIVRENRILALTYTKDAAQEMKDRVGAELDVVDPERKASILNNLHISTFHSCMYSFLRNHIKVKVLDDAKRKEIWKKVVYKHRYDYNGDLVFSLDDINRYKMLYDVVLLLEDPEKEPSKSVTNNSDNIFLEEDSAMTDDGDSSESNSKEMGDNNTARAILSGSNAFKVSSLTLSDFLPFYMKVDDLLLAQTVTSKARFRYYNKKKVEADGSQNTTLLLKLLHTYQELLFEEGYIDFDDMILIPFLILIYNKEIREAYQKTIQYIIIDEAQDIDRRLYKLLSLIYNSEHNRITFIGDNAQSIYGFKGACPSLITSSFSEDFAHENEPPKRYFLTNNFRCSNNIIQVSNDVLAHCGSSDAYNKKLKACKAESKNDFVHVVPIDPKKPGDFIRMFFERFKFLCNGDYSDVAILCSKYLKNYEKELIELFKSNNIPLKGKKGNKAQEHSNDKNKALEVISKYFSLDDSLLFLYLFNADKSDYDMQFIAALPKLFGIRNEEEKDNLINFLFNYLEKDASLSFFKALKLALEQEVELRKIISEESFLKLVKRVEVIDSILTTKDVATLKELLNIIDPPLVKEPFKRTFANLRSLDYIKSLPQNRSPLDRFAYLLKDLSLPEDELLVVTLSSLFKENFDFLIAKEKGLSNKEEKVEDAKDPNSDAYGVLITTIHAAKGREWDKVFILDFTQGIFPFETQSFSTEERRLAYVAMTRAKEELYLCYEVEWGISIIFGCCKDSVKNGHILDFDYNNKVSLKDSYQHYFTFNKENYYQSKKMLTRTLYSQGYAGAQPYEPHPIESLEVNYNENFSFDELKEKNHFFGKKFSNLPKEFLQLLTR